VRTRVSTVDWSAYAVAYDLMCHNNPAYHELVRCFVAAAARIPCSDGDTLVDIGGGTENFSLELARL
jgi:ubiquinone/menaquinone biosynthesis C-methylase UbiE